MYRALVVDDNSDSRDYLASLLDGEGWKVIGQAENGFAALELIGQNNADAVFLDVEMPDINGVKVAKWVLEGYPNLRVVFVTAYRDYAAEAFELEAVDYLLKPFDKRRLHRALLRLAKKKDKEKKDYLLIRWGHEVYSVELDKIVCIERCCSHTLIHTVDGTRKTAEGIKEIESRLKIPEKFLRVHKSYLINLDFIEKITPWGDSSYIVTFKNNPCDALVSRSRAPELWKSLGLK